MIIVKTSSEITAIVSGLKSKNKTIGFVPTMGALHKGHLSLVEKSLANNDVTIISIFVNPTQFNDKSDLEKYPRTLENDLQLLKNISCDIVFAPSGNEMYSKKEKETVFNYDFEGLDKVMEGKFRPNHFNGVVQIVSKLFNYTLPDKAYFGEKDFQQVAIIRQMTKKMNYPIEIISCPIIREENGLAMSSRNELLSSDERKIASNISKVLFESRNFVLNKSVSEIQQYVIEQINATSGLLVEYYDIVDGYSLQSINKWSDHKYVVGCITVICGNIRLIDNIQYK